MKSTARDMADSLEMWGIDKVYRLGLGVQATQPGEIPAPIMRTIHRTTDKLAHQIRKNAGKRGCNRRGAKWFHIIRFTHRHFPPAEPEYSYWEERGWHGKKRPWDAE